MRPLKIGASYEVRVSPTGEFCLSIGRDVNLWDLGARKKCWQSHPFSHPSQCDFSPDGSLIAVKSTMGQIVLLDQESGRIAFDFENQAEGEGCNLLFSNCGDYLVDGSWDGLLTIRETSSGRIKWQRGFNGEMISHICSIGDGDIWITEHHPKATFRDRPPEDCYFLKWSWPFWKSAPQKMFLTLPFICSTSFDRSGTMLAVVFGAPPRELRVYEIESKEQLWSADISAVGSGKVKWSPCGRFLGAVQRARIAVYDATNGNVIGEHALPYPSDVAFSPEGKLLALGSWQAGEVRVFEVTRSCERSRRRGFGQERSTSEVVSVTPGENGAAPNERRSAEQRAGCQGVVKTKVQERPLTPDEQAEVAYFARQGATRLGIGPQGTPEAYVRAVSKALDEFRKKHRKPSDDAVLVFALECGPLWSGQLVRTLGWEWTAILEEGEPFYAVAAPDRSRVVYPVVWFGDLARDRRMENNLILVFNMLRAGNLPPASAGAYREVR